MRNRTKDPEPGMKAMYATHCARCGEYIERGERIAHQRGEYIHVGCASGADDE